MCLEELRKWNLNQLQNKEKFLNNIRELGVRMTLILIGGNEGAILLK